MLCELSCISLLLLENKGVVYGLCRAYLVISSLPSFISVSWLSTVPAEVSFEILFFSNQSFHDFGKDNDFENKDKESDATREKAHSLS
jgi:hypothetical protein